MKDFRTGREINIKEAVLVVGNKVYAKESFITVDTSRLIDYPPKVYYDKDEELLGKMYDEGVFELDDIEDILLDHEDQSFSNHDLDDIRKFLVERRKRFYEKLSQNQ